jgi:hypothetical protein
MILKRCPSCRTLCDAERDARCFACGGELNKAGPPAQVRVPDVLRTSGRDRKSSSALLIIFAVFGGLGVFFIVMNSTVDLGARIPLGVILIAAVILGSLSLGSKGGAVETVGRSFLKLFAFFGVLILGGAALLIGLLILLFAACATGLMR